MKVYQQWAVICGMIFLAGCGSDQAKNDQTSANDTTAAIEATDDFQYAAEEFADIRILRYKVPGFDELTLKEKELLYYLYEAALAGRDITWDQNCKHNLCVRRTLENIVSTYSGEKSGDNWDKFMEYTKRVWFSNGIQHHYSTAKLIPEFSEDYFKELTANSKQDGFPLEDGETVDQLVEKLTSLMFDPKLFAKRVNKDDGVDKVVNSANNFYEGVTEKEVMAFYSKMKGGDQDPEWGLNSKVVKENGVVKEKVWKIGGMYDSAIQKIVYWLEKASGVAENALQKDALDKLIVYYKSGDLHDFDAYNIAWVKDVNSKIDVVNGFIEVYGDPLGKKGSFESVVSVRDMEASKRIVAFSNEAQWFEDNAPIMDNHKKKNVTGISAKVINVVMESGDSSPSTPIGINLPNSNWIRSTHGSKSVNLGNIVYAYDEASKSSGLLDEFCYTQEEIDRAKKDAGYSDKLQTDIHEVIGHASGVINPGVGETSETLRHYASTLEEGRADLMALYYIPDQKLIDLGVMESLETGKAAYDDYIRNGLMLQLRRIDIGDNIEEDHMRNRQMVCKWALEMGEDDNVIERKEKEGKTYFVVNDYDKLRYIFGQQLRELQRIKSEGDFEAGKSLVESYGVKVDPEIHKEVKERFEALHLAPYSGFINPRLVAVKEGDKIVDVKIEYSDDFTGQMLHYGKNHSFLPTYN